MRRFNRNRRCSVCGGYDSLGRGKGIRCSGFISDDGRWGHCSREEHAGALDFIPSSGTFAHLLEGDCRCGTQHGPARPTQSKAGVVLGQYDYRDESGAIVHRVVRLEPKAFRQCRPDGFGGWIWDMKGVRRVLYRLPELLASDEASLVFIPEGERHVDELGRLGLVATTNVSGAGKWRPEYAEYLKGRHVVVLPDNDDVGQNHAHDVARSLVGIASSIKVLMLPGLEAKGDVINWLQSGGDVEKLLKLADAMPLFADATPLFAGEKHSAAPSGDVLAERKIFISAAELEQHGNATVEWVAFPWIAKGAITELGGQVKSAGKTTFITYMIRAILDGREFMGGYTTKTPVVYLTEQPVASFGQSLRRAGLMGRHDLSLAPFFNTARLKWPDVVSYADEECSRLGAQLLVVDTIHQFAGMSGDSENQAGAALAAIKPLQELAGKGVAVVIVRHDRKGGGAVGQSGRGSSALSGAVDIVLSLRRPEGNHKETIRRIEAISRFDETPSLLTIELTDEGYMSHGDETAVSLKNAREQLLNSLPEHEADAIELERLCELARVSRSTAQQALKQLIPEYARVTGEGKKGSPYRYYKPLILSAGTPSTNGQHLFRT